MNTGPALGAVTAVVLATVSLGIAQRLRPEPVAGEDPPGPHPVMSTIGGGLLSGYVLLTGFLVVTGWAAKHSTAGIPPTGLYLADTVAGLAVLLYPALAGLPFTFRNTAAVAFLAAIVGYALGEAFQLRP